MSERRAAGLKIDPDTAEVDWEHANMADPYGVNPDLPAEYKCIGRVYFACAPGTDIWVEFSDLPEKTRDALWERIETGKLKFPDSFEWLLENP
jgi:hypothetical protein